jgi:hypothetical protein
MKRKRSWRKRIEQFLHISGHSGAAPFFHAVVQDLAALPETRKSFAGPQAVFMHLTRMVAVYGASFVIPQELGSAWQPDAAAATVLVQMRGELREVLAWLRARPDWVASLERHHRLLGDDLLYGPAFNGLLLLVRDHPAARDLDEIPAAVRKALANDEGASTRDVEPWRKRLRHVTAGFGIDTPAPWIEAVADDLWRDPRTATLVADVSNVSAFLLSTVSLSWIVTSHDDSHPPDDEFLQELAQFGLALEFLKKNKYWRRVMKTHSALLPPGPLRGAIMLLYA